MRKKLRHSLRIKCLNINIKDSIPNRNTFQIACQHQFNPGLCIDLHLLFLITWMFYFFGQNQTFEFEQGGLRDLLPAARLVQRQSSSPLVRWRKHHHRPAPEAWEQLQLVATCREEDVALKTERWHREYGERAEEETSVIVSKLVWIFLFVFALCVLLQMILFHFPFI